MFDNTRRNRSVLAGIAGVNLCVALAVGAGALPLPGAGSDGRSAETVASASVAGDAGLPAGQPAEIMPAVVGDTTTIPPTTAPTAPTSVAPTSVVTSPPRSRSTVPAAAPPVTAAAVSSPLPPAPVQVLRRVPAAAEVQQAIATLPRYVRSLIAPSPAQVAQLGDKVCTMFDQGQTFAQVKAVGLQMVTQVPLTSVLPGGADWVVQTAVTLYCPGHLAKLG